MQYKKIECQDYNIHLIKNNRFHAINFNVIFTQNVNKELITYQNLLTNILTYSTEKDDTNMKLLRKCQELYSLRPTAFSTRYGNLYATNFGISILNPKYLKDVSIKDNILLLKEVILNPLVKDNAFDEKLLDFIKEEERAYVLSAREDTRSYSNIRLLELMGEDNYTLTGYSNLDVLKKVNAHNLFKQYQEMLAKSKIDFFISGDFKNEEEIIDLIKENFIFPREKFKLNNPYTYHENRKQKYCLFNEKISYLQSKISLGFKFYDLTEYENKYVIGALNILIGGDNNAYLMKKVREEKSLCYYIGSFASKLDNILIINSGIKKENKDEVIKIIKEIFKEIENGLFTEKELNNVKTELTNYFLNMEDSNNNLIQYYYGIEVFNADTIQRKKEIIKRITKEDIMNLAKKINLDTVFWLEGDL